MVDMAGMVSKFRCNLSAPASLRGFVAIALAVFAFAGLAAVHAQTRTITTTTTTHTYSRSSSFQFNIEQESSGSSCSPGYGSCDGKCAPIGSVCCRGGGYCPHANLCTQDGKCLSLNSPRACGGGTYCAPGYICGPGNSCVSEAATEKLRQSEQAVRDLERKMDEERREKEAADKREADKFGTASDRMMREFAERQRTETAPSSAVAPSPPGQSHIRTGLPGLPGAAAPTKRTASRDETSPPPPTVVIQGMQVNPQSPGNGSRFNVPTPCQDLTGAAGCANSGASSWSSGKFQQVQNRWQHVQNTYSNLPQNTQDQQRQAVTAAITDLTNDASELPDIMIYLGCPQGDYNCVASKLRRRDPSGDQATGGGPRPTVSARRQEPNEASPNPDADKYCEPDDQAPDAGVKICWQHASNGYCKKWRESSNGRILPNDIYGADDSFSDYMKVNFTQHCPEKALPLGHNRSTGRESGTWLVIAGSWSPNENQKLNARMNLLSSNGIRARVVKTDDFPKLSPGLSAVVLGPFSKDQAQAQLVTVQSSVPDAFIKEGL